MPYMFYHVLLFCSLKLELQDHSFMTNSSSTLHFCEAFPWLFISASTSLHYQCEPFFSQYSPSVLSFHRHYTIPYYPKCSPTPTHGRFLDFKFPRFYIYSMLNTLNKTFQSRTHAWKKGCGVCGFVGLSNLTWFFSVPFTTFKFNNLTFLYRYIIHHCTFVHHIFIAHLSVDGYKLLWLEW